MRVMLAPMDGVTDHHMRDILTRLGGYDRCVTEFLRVTDHVYPHKVFLKSCPELASGGLTPAGTRVYLQLLGSNPKALAENACRAAALGAPGIDLNFGCPAKTVNRHGGGSALLRTPAVVGEIVKAVRDAVPPSIPVTAKIRLGYDDSALLLQTAALIEQAGADELCVHARTRNDGYKPPAYWSQVCEVRQQLTIPVIVNGEIWTVEQALQACTDSRCVDVMLGRGALARPLLATEIGRHQRAMVNEELAWFKVLDLLDALLVTASDLPAKYAGNRTKQWLTYLRLYYPAAAILFDQIKRLREMNDIKRAIEAHRRLLHTAVVV